MSKSPKLPGKAGSFRFADDARDQALKVLALLDEGRPIQSALDDILISSSLSNRDRRLCTELVYGCARERIRTDFILSQLLPNPERLPRLMLHVLAIAIHSLMFQTRIPAHAAISQAVAQAKRHFGLKLARVANGALRSFQRLGAAPQDLSWYEDRKIAPEKRCWQAQCLFWSLPESIANLWRQAYGDDGALMLMRRSFRRPWTGIRFNARSEKASAIRQELERTIPESERVAIGNSGLAFAPGVLPQEVSGSPLADLRSQGHISFQSAGSQTVIAELGLASWQGSVWDACAGAGGKSLALLENGVVVQLATDLSATRLAQLACSCAASGIAQPALAIADASRPPLRSWKGHILADVPCSGLGILARRPDIRFPERRSQRILKQYAASQRMILKSLAQFLKSGRQLAYITCTLNPEENENLIGAMLKEDRGLTLVRSWSTPIEHPWLEGMYGALLERL